LLRGKGKFYRDSVKLSVVFRRKRVAVGAGTGTEHGHAFDKAHYVVNRILDAGGDLTKGKGIDLSDTEEKRGRDL
jgi:hypothetical protein